MATHTPRPPDELPASRGAAALATAAEAMKREETAKALMEQRKAAKPP